MAEDASDEEGELPTSPRTALGDGIATSPAGAPRPAASPSAFALRSASPYADRPLPRVLLVCVEFIALFPMPHSRARLLSAVPPPASHDAIAEHCTVAHAAHGRDALSSLTPAFAALIGRRVRLVATASASDASVCVAPVRWPRDACIGSGGGGSGGGSDGGVSRDSDGGGGSDGGSGSGGGGGDSGGGSGGGRGGGGEPACSDDATSIVAGALARMSRRAEHSLGCNAVPHVTVGLARGASARASNALLERAARGSGNSCSGSGTLAPDAAPVRTWPLAQPVRLWARLGVAVFDPSVSGPPAASRRIIADAVAWREWVASKG